MSASSRAAGTHTQDASQSVLEPHQYQRPDYKPHATALQQFTQWCKDNSVTVPYMQNGKEAHTNRPNKSKSDKSLMVRFSDGRILAREGFFRKMYVFTDAYRGQEWVRRSRHIDRPENVALLKRYGFQCDTTAGVLWLERGNVVQIGGLRLIVEATWEEPVTIDFMEALLKLCRDRSNGFTRSKWLKIDDWHALEIEAQP